MFGFNNVIFLYLGVGVIWSKCLMNESSIFVENVVDMICVSYLKVIYIKYMYNLMLIVEYWISIGRVF